jgi:predicted NAD/FAD-dependent oxidoreductase
VLDGPSKVPDPGGVQLDEGPFSFVADNQAKGLSSIPALTLHATAEMSQSLWDDSDAKVQASLLAAAEEWIGDANVVETRVTRWRHATPRFVWTDRYCRVAESADGGPVLLAGDAFAGPRVEGAWLSGHAAGGYLLG